MLASTASAFVQLSKATPKTSIRMVLSSPVRRMRAACFYSKAVFYHRIPVLSTGRVSGTL